jgi:hypothetical protein
MKWLRSNVKSGSRVALFALAIQFVLSFGHFHPIAANAAPVIATAVTLTVPDLAAPPAGGSAEKQRPSSDDSDQQPADGCAICAVMSAAHHVLFTAPPPLLLPQAVEFSYRRGGTEFIDVKPVHPAFQSRAPPSS